MNISGRETTFLQRDNVVTQCQGDTKENTLWVGDFLDVTLLCDDGVKVWTSDGQTAPTSLFDV